jgi:uncharacterized membrane protein
MSYGKGDTTLQIQDLLKLAGVAVVVIGLALRLRATLVVVVAALVTGLVAGLPLFSHEGFFQYLPYLTKPGQTGIINTLGKAFADNRLMTLFIITLPAIGLAERYGLQERSANLIRRIRAATVGRLLIVYQLFRALHGVMGIRIYGHPSFVRPLIFPMSAGAAPSSNTESIEKIKAANAAAENYGFFYPQNLNPVQAGILLVYGVMQGIGQTVSIGDLLKYSIPVTAGSIFFGVLQFLWLDRVLRRMAEAKR